MKESQKIYFICPDIEKPSGGIKQIYRQVNVLSEAGYDAYILHQKNGFRCHWFDNKVPVRSHYKLHESIQILNKPVKKDLKSQIKKMAKSVLKKSHPDDIEIKEADIVVYPEVYGPDIANVLPHNRFVIYNQGAYQTFFKHDVISDSYAYHATNCIGVITNSENGKHYLQYAFPDMNVSRVFYGFDDRKFISNSEKKKQISFMGRRLRGDAIQLFNILNSRGALNSWEVVEIYNMNETEVAQVLNESAVFLSLSINEGFGMPPAEAMLSSCYVVGYPGRGGEEFFKADFCFPVIDRDVLGLSEAMENTLSLFNNNWDAMVQKGIVAKDYIKENYSLSKEKNSILKAWSDILN
jgi:hypothetical protein